MPLAVGPAGFSRASQSAASSQVPASSYTEPQQSFPGWPNLMPSTWWLRSGIDGDEEGVAQGADDDAYSVSDESGQYGRDLDPYWVVPGVNAPPDDSSQQTAASSANNYWEPPPAVAQLPDASSQDYYLPFDEDYDYDYDFASSPMMPSISIPSYPTPQVDRAAAREPAAASMMASPALGDVVRLPIPGTATMVRREPPRRSGPTAATTSDGYSSSADEAFYIPSPAAPSEDQGPYLPSPASSWTSTADGDGELFSLRQQQGQRSSRQQQPPSSAPAASYGTNIAIPRQGGGQELIRINSEAYERSPAPGTQSGFFLG